MIDITSHYFRATDTLILLSSLNILDIVSDDDLKYLSPSHRNCKFSNEIEGLEYSHIYSYNLCRIECRMRLCVKYCNCTPYYYRRNGMFIKPHNFFFNTFLGEPVCNMTGMYCLSKHPGMS